jgi:hypothetical protein
MRATRRGFQSTILIAGCALALGAPLSDPQGIKRGMPTPPRSAQDDASKNNPSAAPDPRAAKRAQVARNEKEFREGVERLYLLTHDLREAVQQTPTSAVLSVPMVKKTEEIEKLAKQLKNKAKGG